MPKKLRKQSKPISLNPLKFDEAIVGLLKVKPESGKGEPKMAHENPLGAKKQSSSGKKAGRYLLKEQTKDTPIAQVRRREKKSK